jgi:threonine dehydratase
MDSLPDVTLQDIYRARKRIAALARRTPLVSSQRLHAPADVHLKLENLQATGSFKLRGAANKLLGLTAAEKERGVITISSGNHGRAVSFVARHLGIRAVVCLSEAVTKTKLAAIKRLGAEAVVHGNTYDQAEEEAFRLQQERELTMIEPFDDPDIIAGQGTIGLELLEDLPEIDTAVVPLSGGGLISGIALALKSADPAIRVIGVSMDRAPVMYHSLRAGALIQMDEEESIADALVGGIGLANKYTFRMVQQYVDETVLVSEEEIAAGMAFALEEHHQVIEGGAAVGIAALLHQRVNQVGRHVAVIVSGGNVGTERLLETVGWARISG